MPSVIGSFDDLRFKHVRYLEGASRRGELRVSLLSDKLIQKLGNAPPRFSQDERLYLVQAIRYVSKAALLEEWADPRRLPLAQVDLPETWVVDEAEDSPAKRAFCEFNGLEYHVLSDAELEQPTSTSFQLPLPDPQRKRVIVTGCFDWLHSGHVRFFEEASALGDLFVVVGHDENLRLLKGDGHPFFGQEERRYMVQAVRYVTGALISTGYGWMDAEPEINVLQPDIYVVNEDGDKPEKRAFCAARGIEYVVLQRQPKPGLPRRESTDLRGF